MKKIYIAPELVVVKINPVAVICASDILPEGEEEYDGVAETSQYRWKSVWDDEW